MFVHYSTDYVFNGEKQMPYVESDRTCSAQHVWRHQARRRARRGRRRWALSSSCVQAGSTALTAHNFLLTIRRLAQENEELKIVSDQIGAPTSSGQIARATARLVQRFAASPQDEFPAGLYHMTAAGSTSWFGFAQAIVTRRRTRKLQRLLPQLTSEYPTPAKRPMNSLLDNTRFEKTFGFRLGDWESATASVLRELELRQTVSN